jgi:hypothetical protein
MEKLGMFLYPSALVAKEDGNLLLHKAHSAYKLKSTLNIPRVGESVNVYSKGPSKRPIARIHILSRSSSAMVVGFSFDRRHPTLPARHLR